MATHVLVDSESEADMTVASPAARPRTAATTRQPQAKAARLVLREEEESESDESESDETRPAARARSTDMRARSTDMRARSTDMRARSTDMRARTRAKDMDSTVVEDLTTSLQHEHYDPDQDVEERRWVRQQYRSLISSVEELAHNPQSATKLKEGADDDHHRDLIAKLDEANRVYSMVKNPNEATLDAKFLVLSANLGAQRARKLQSELRQFDVAEFLRRVARFTGGGAGGNSAAARRAARRRMAEDDEADAVEEEDEEESGVVDWARLGRRAQTFVASVPCATFMLGPLSIERKQRQVQRHARLVKREEDLKRPEELKAADIQKNENETTRNLGMVHQCLSALGPTPYWRFVINPHSFSQTVENIFYCAFLAKDGRLDVQPGSEESGGDAVVQACEQGTEEERAAMDKYQHMVSIDMYTWKQLIRKFDIRNSCIPTRKPVAAALSTSSGNKWY